MHGNDQIRLDYLLSLGTIQNTVFFTKIKTELVILILSPDSEGRVFYRNVKRSNTE